MTGSATTHPQECRISKVSLGDIPTSRAREWDRKGKKEGGKGKGWKRGKNRYRKRGVLKRRMGIAPTHYF